MLGLCRGRRRHEERLADLEERIEGLEFLIADLPRPQRRGRHSNGRGLLPGAAKLYQEAQAREDNS